MGDVVRRLRVWIPSNRTNPKTHEKRSMDGLNEIIDQNRTNRYVGARIERENLQWCAWHIKKAMLDQHWKAQLERKDAKCVRIFLRFVEANGRRDYSNIIAGSKYVLDALSRPRGKKEGAGAIYDDSQMWITDIRFVVDVDSGNPGIEVIVQEA